LSYLEFYVHLFAIAKASGEASLRYRGQDLALSDAQVCLLGA